MTDRITISEWDALDFPEVLRELEKQNKMLSILYEVALTVGKSLDLKTILDDALEKIIAFMEADSGVIYVIHNETLEMIPVSFQNLSEEVIRDLTENRVRVGECMCGTIAQYAREILIPEKASSDPRFTRDTLKREGMEFYAGLPLISKGNVVGVLCVITHAPYKPDPELLELLRTVTVPVSLAIENAQLFEDTRRKVEQESRYDDFHGIITDSAKMKKILSLVRKITDVPSSILIFGESGTGKELIARAIHFNSNRRNKPFVTINCAAIPEPLLESEFFGYVKGAFTGACGDKQGLLESADGGSIFLDEVEAMSKNLQAKLLRALQNGTFFKVGGTKSICVDVRIIAATNRQLQELVKAGQFREDLYYRLNVIRIDLPPLREKVEDIPLLVRHFLTRFSRKIGKKIRRVSDEAMEALMHYSWPGNVRELENAIERAVAVSETEIIRKEDLPFELSMLKTCHERAWTLAYIETEHIKKVLNITHGNKKKAARLLGIDTTTLWRKLNRMGK